MSAAAQYAKLTDARLAKMIRHLNRTLDRRDLAPETLQHIAARLRLALAEAESRADLRRRRTCSQENECGPEACACAAADASGDASRVLGGIS